MGEKIIEKIFLICALVSIISVVTITIYVFVNGLKPFVQGSYPFINFISGTEWRPGSNMYGIFYMIVGSIFATLGAIIIGVPVALLTAIFISEMAGTRVGKIVRFAVELLAGIPSVLYGVFGLGIIVPAVLKISP
ncbi:MAG: phosphate ABC transporter permease subunit PstC, partial [Eubacterium sp.]